MYFNEIIGGRTAQKVDGLKELMRQEHVAGVAELGDARDLKSCGPLAYAGSTPAPGTIVFNGFSGSIVG